MVKISASELARLAELSQLELSDDKLNHLGTDLEKILGFIDQLNEVDTDGVEPTYQVLDAQNVWREDEIKADISPKELLALRDQDEIYQQQIKVPKVL